MHHYPYLLHLEIVLAEVVNHLSHNYSVSRVKRSIRNIGSAHIYARSKQEHGMVLTAHVLRRNSGSKGPSENLHNIGLLVPAALCQVHCPKAAFAQLLHDMCGHTFTQNSRTCSGRTCVSAGYRHSGYLLRAVSLQNHDSYDSSSTLLPPCAAARLSKGVSEG